MSLPPELIPATGMSISESAKLDDGLPETNADPEENEDGVFLQADFASGLSRGWQARQWEGRFPGRD